MDRNLDGCYFRVHRDGEWQNVCFSDLNALERDAVCKDHSAEWFKSLAYHLADQLAIIGEQFNIVGD